MNHGRLPINETDGKFLAVKQAPDQNSDGVGHGTAVASVIARLAPNARIVDIRVLSDPGKASGAAVLAGLKHTLELRTRVINISLALKTHICCPVMAAFRTGLPAKSDYCCRKTKHASC